MQSRLKFNSAVLVVLTGLFLFTKFNLTRLRVPAFGLDPCDAVMHFAFFVILLALVSSLRSMRPYREGVGYTIQNIHVLRSQSAVALAMFIAVFAHLTTLARNPSMWIGAHWRNQLLVWLGVFAVVPIAAELVVVAAQQNRELTSSSQRNRAVLSCLLAVAALVFCPEYGSNLSSETAHILTVIVGGLVVLVPTGYLLPVLLPYKSGERESSEPFFKTSNEQFALLFGILLGIFLFWVDAHRAGSARPLLPTLKFLGPVMGLLLAYAFLAATLGLAANTGVNSFTSRPKLS